MDVPSFKHLQALSALANAPSLSRAAEDMGVTRSALSHRIADLERQLGVALVRRTGRCASLTDDARALLDAMGDALNRIEAAVAPLHRRRGQIRISTVSTFAAQWLIPRLGDWQRAHPGMELAISSTTRMVDLDTEDFDAAIRHGLGHWPGLTVTRLFVETLVPVACPEIDGLSSKAVLVRARSRFLDWPHWWRATDKVGSLPDRMMMVDTRAQAMDAALAGVGIAMMDARYAAPHLASGRLHALGPTIELAAGYYYVTSQARSIRTEARESLRTWLVDQASKGVTSGERSTINA